MMRPTTSGVPPAANGTITRTGLPGYGCATAPAHNAHSAAVETRTSRQRRSQRMVGSYGRFLSTSARLDARHELERVLPLDGQLIRGAEAPVRDALVDLRAVA